MTGWRFGPRSLAVAAVVCLAALVLAPTAHSFTIPDYFGLTINPGKQWGEWPTRGGKATIPYATRSNALESSVRAAVKAWNGGGANVAFRKVPWKRAKVHIVQRGRLPKGYCGLTPTAVRWRFNNRTGQPKSPGEIIHSKILIAKRCRNANLVKDEHFERWVVAHELGHALGLDHAGGCSIMQPSLPSDRRSPHHCRELTGKWFCGLITPDDVAGARWLYGGRKKDPTRYCLLYPDVARLPKRIEVSVVGSSSAGYELPDSSENWSWSAQATLVRRKITNLPSRAYEVESGEITWSTSGTGPEWRLDPDAKTDPNNFENLDCSYAGGATVPLEPGEKVLTIGVLPDPDQYEADAYQFNEVPVSGECAAGEFEDSRPLDGEVEAPDWLVTGEQRGSIREGLGGSHAVEASGDFNSADGSVSWTMTVADSK